jgi:tetratricopeptide (TPR) repeat protein
LGYLYGEEDNIPKMLESFNKSLSKSEEFKIDIEKQKKYYWATNFNKGVELFNKASSEKNNNLIKKYYDNSIKEFKNAVNCRPDYVDTYRNLAFAYININDYDKAIEPLQKIIKMDKTPDAYDMLGSIYMQKGTDAMNHFREDKIVDASVKAMQWFDKAISVLEDGRDSFPKDGNLLVSLTNAYISADKEEVAIGTMAELVKREPDNKIYNYSYGTLLFNAKQYEKAEKYLIKAIKLDQQYIEALNNLGATYINWGLDLRQATEETETKGTKFQAKFEEAIKCLKKSAKFKSDDPIVWERLGQTFAILGKINESFDAYKKADELRKK